jgi:PAS domain S-box-containing protein
LVETSPDAIIAADIRGKITMCNQRAVALHGYGSSGEMAGAHLRDLVAVPEADLFARNPESIWSGECTLRRQDGSVFPGELTTAGLYDNQRSRLA